MTVTSVTQGAITLSASPGGAYFVGLGGIVVSTTRERQSDSSTTKLVRLDCEVREAAVEVPPQKTTIRIEPRSGVTTDINKKEASG